MKVLVLTLLALISWALCISQSQAKSRGWICVYSKVSSQDGIASANNFKLEFALDDITKKAVMIGNNGVANVDFHSGNSSITFMEALGTGAVQTTTVATNGASVHSRHSVIGVILVPSQYYGRCTAR